MLPLPEIFCEAPNSVLETSVDGIGAGRKYHLALVPAVRIVVSLHPDLNSIGKIIPTCTLDAPST